MRVAIVATSALLQSMWPARFTMLRASELRLEALAPARNSAPRA